MIPEPPDGTKLVVITPGLDDQDPDFVVTRDDESTLDTRSVRLSGEHWVFPDPCYGFGWVAVTWQELQTMGTLHLIGPELKEM